MQQPLKLMISKKIRKINYVDDITEKRQGKINQASAKSKQKNIDKSFTLKKASLVELNEN